MLKSNIYENRYPINYYSIKKAILVLKALDHKIRQQIIDTIDENNTLTVTELYNKLGLEQSVASQQLGILRKAGVVTATRHGKKIHYAIDKERLSVIEQHAEDLLTKLTYTFKK
jgi:ArsR family transcriptional regulator, virulence genes transcriptional regulator